MTTLPPITYPDLPITERRDDVLAAIRDHQVVVVAGETGSGKSTQLPKMCLELGRGAEALIGHTQPRRLAARTVAARIAEELGTELGDLVGYTVRFTDQVSDAHPGQAHDRRHPARRAATRPRAAPLRHAHRRRGPRAQPQHRLPPRLPHRAAPPPARPQADRHLGHHRHRALRRPLRRPGRRGVGPHLPGRGPLPAALEDRDQVDAIRAAVDELRREGPGDILVFLSGEREIHDTADRPRPTRRCADTEILPLYARLSAAEQQRAFRPTAAGASCWPPTWPRRRSPCPASATSSTPAPPASPATTAAPRSSACRSRRSARRRRTSGPGRCGRVAPGICIRLYDEEDFDARPEFTEPEILRTNLASVILQMAALRPGRRRVVPVRRPARRPRHPRRRRPAGRARGDAPRPHADQASGGAWPGCPSTPGSGA